MRYIIDILFRSASVLALSACQSTPSADTIEITASTPRQESTDETSAQPAPQPETVSFSGTTGTDAYNWGYSNASDMLQNKKTTADLRDELLELKARHYHIKCNSGSKAADDYMLGIQDCLREKSDTLYTTLFAQN